MANVMNPEQQQQQPDSGILVQTEVLQGGRAGALCRCAWPFFIVDISKCDSFA